MSGILYFSAITVSSSLVHVTGMLIDEHANPEMWRDYGSIIFIGQFRDEVDEDFSPICVLAYKKYQHSTALAQWWSQKWTTFTHDWILLEQVIISAGYTAELEAQYNAAASLDQCLRRWARFEPVLEQVVTWSGSTAGM